MILFAVDKPTVNVRVAQLDRASGYGPEGREFESCRVHYQTSVLLRSFFYVIENAVYHCIKKLRRD